MSIQNKTTAHLQTDSETGIVLAHIAHADGVEARRAELTDAKAISKAQADLGAFENRINHLNGLSDMFNDEDDGPISMGAITPVEPEITAAGDSPSSLELDEEDALGMEEEFVIGGLFDEDDDDLLGNVFPEEDLMAPFDDDAISGAVEEVLPETALQDEDLTDFTAADDVELERNREISEAARADAEDLAEDDLSFLHDEDEPASKGEEGEEMIGEAVAIAIADDEMGEAEAPQSLSALVAAPTTSRETVDPPDADEAGLPAEPQDEDDLQSFGDMLDDDVGAGEADAAESGSSFDEMPVPAWASTDDGLSIPGTSADEVDADPVDDGEDLLAWAVEDAVESTETEADSSNSVDFSDVSVFDRVEDGDTPDYATEVADYRDGTEGPDAAAGMPDLSLEEGDTGVSENARINDDEEEDVLPDIETPSSDDIGWLDTGEDDTDSRSDGNPPEDATNDPEDQTPGGAHAKKGRLKVFYITAAVTALLVSTGGFFALQKMNLVPGTAMKVDQPAIAALPGDGAIAATYAGQAEAGPGLEEVMTPGAPAIADKVYEEDMGDVTVDPTALPDEVAPVVDVIEDNLDAPTDDGSLSDLMLNEDFTDPVSEAPAGEAMPEVTDKVTQDLADAANGNFDSLFLEDEPKVAEEAPAVTEDMLAGLASQDEVGKIREAIDLMFERIETMSDEIVERDQAIVDLQTRLANAEASAQRAETLALGQNEVLAEFLRVKEKVDMAENLIVDLSRRTAAMETTDPADRVAVERSINDLNDRLEGVARDLGLIARVAINGSPERVQTRSNPGIPDVPGAGAIYEQSTGGIAAPGEAAQIPSDVKVGDFVQGYGSVLQIMPTSDGARVVVMENKSVLIP